MASLWSSFDVDATCCILMHNRLMAASGVLRQTVSLPVPTVRRVKALARTRAQSTSRVLAELVEAGLSQQERQRQEFMAQVECYRQATDPVEVKRLGDELGRRLFGH